MRAAPTLALVLLAATALALAPEVEQARKALEAGSPDDVLGAIEGAKLTTAEDRRAAADVLADAGEKSLKTGDSAFALMLAQKAMKLEPQHGRALALAAASCRADKEFGAAERYADKWILTSKAPEARVLRAELAMDQGEWQRALDFVKPLEKEAQEKGALSDTLRDRRDALVKQAQGELELYETGMSVLKGVVAKQLEGGGSGEAVFTQPPSASSAGVTVYSTSWCGYCRKLKSWLEERNVAFTEHDIEKDKSAASALAAKARRQGVRLGGVPVTDVKGTLVVGFDTARIEKLLK